MPLHTVKLAYTIWKITSSKLTCNFKHISTQLLIHICVLPTNTTLKGKNCKIKCLSVMKFYISHLNAAPTWFYTIKYMHTHFVQDTCII